MNDMPSTRYTDIPYMVLLAIPVAIYFYIELMGIFFSTTDIKSQILYTFFDG